ncbi:hypothetical protein [Pasteuria penetrans]|uniref:hypothetical protein n=1 Tax=Pasteuria penetrans TaxID=86005 RepID=UPI0011EE7D6D|nr:hypothetical protein [Pasteuria penetrans]
MAILRPEGASITIKEVNAVSEGLLKTWSSGAQQHWGEILNPTIENLPDTIPSVSYHYVEGYFFFFSATNPQATRHCLEARSINSAGVCVQTGHPTGT